MHDESRNKHRHQRRNKNLTENTSRGDRTSNPKHNGGYIANGRESTTRVGRYNHKGGINQTVVLVGHEFSQHHNHHNTRGEVVEDGRKEECHKGNTPQQSTFALCFQGIAHKVEAAIGVYNLNNGHRTHEEEERFGRFAQMFFQAFAHMCHNSSSITSQFGDEGHNIICWINHKECPASHTHQERHWRLVHLRQAFESNAKITHNENNDDCHS